MTLVEGLLVAILVMLFVGIYEIKSQIWQIARLLQEQVDVGRHDSKAH